MNAPASHDEVRGAPITRAQPAPAAPEGVSVVVCNYNGAKHLPECLRAILAQTRAPDEILVVDNASTDDSLAIVRERCPQARVVPMQHNDGPCPARNAGLASARFRWVLLVDNDAVLAPDVLEKLLASARARPDACMLQPRSVLFDCQDTVHYDGGRLHYIGLFSLRNFYRPLAGAEGQGTLEVDGVISVVLLCERQRLIDAGGFDEAFFILFEDLDLSLRLRSAGCVLLSVEDALVLHRGGTPGISFRGEAAYPAQRAFFHSRNRWLVLVKNYRWRTLLVALPGILAYEVVWLAFTLESGGFFAHLRGKWAFFRLLPRALEQRRRIQAARMEPDRAVLVGGPLTISPHLVERAFPRAVLVLLDRTLALWWRLARHLSG